MTIRVAVVGLGAMGRNAVRLLQSKEDVRLVAAFDTDESLIGERVADIVGPELSSEVRVAPPSKDDLANAEPDVVLHAVTAFADEAEGPIIEALECGANVVTITQELVFPVGPSVAVAEQIDLAARDNRKTVVAAGVNPGYVMDMLPALASVACWQVDRVEALRVVDFSPYGPDEMRHIGIGWTKSEFDAALTDDTVGHIGLLESAAYLNAALDLGVTEMIQEKRPIISDRERKATFAHIPPGTVMGFEQEVSGLAGDRTVLSLRMTGLVGATEQELAACGDSFTIHGLPTVEVKLPREISQLGGLATAAVAVNMIPGALKAGPGLVSTSSLPLPHYWSGREPS